jgi:hypothetical protein
MMLPYSGAAIAVQNLCRKLNDISHLPVPVSQQPKFDHQSARFRLATTSDTSDHVPATGMSSITTG